MPTVIRTPAADADIEQITDYIGFENHNPAAARRLIDDLNDKFLLYAEQPEMGEPRPELAEDLRSFPFKKNFVVIYPPLDDGIEVLRVFHGSRDYPTFFS